MRLVVDIPLLRVVKDCCVAGNLMQAESSKWHVSEMAARRYLCPCRDRIDQSAPAREMRLLDTDKMWVFWLPTSSIFAGIEIDIMTWHGIVLVTDLMGGSVDDFWRACKAAVQNRILTCITVGLLRGNYTYIG